MNTTPTEHAGPAPGAIPLIGHAFQLRFRPLELLSRLAGHDDIVELRLGRVPAYLICHPELVQRVLLDECTFEKGGPLYRELAVLLGDSLATSTRERHRAQRRMAQPSFHLARMPGYATVMADEIERMMASWTPGAPISLSESTRAMTLRVVARCLFSTVLRDETMNAVQTHLPIFSDGVYRRMTQPIWLLKKLPSPANFRFDRSVSSLKSTLRNIIAECRSAGLPSDCIMADMLTYRDDSGRGLSEQELLDHVIILFLAGAETSSTAIAWAFYVLTQHPEVERALHREVDAVLGRRTITFADLERLDYTSRFVTETLRVYPPIWIVTRVVSAPTTLGRVRLRPGSNVIISPYAMQRNAAVFDNPTKFDPERWSAQRRRQVSRHAFIPFGAGSRKCIGDQFGTIETTMAVAAVASRWWLRLSATAPPVREIPMTSLNAGPLLVTPTPRPDP